MFKLRNEDITGLIANASFNRTTKREAIEDFVLNNTLPINMTDLILALDDLFGFCPAKSGAVSQAISYAVVLTIQRMCSATFDHCQLMTGNRSSGKLSDAQQGCTIWCVFPPWLFFGALGLILILLICMLACCVCRQDRTRRRCDIPCDEVGAVFCGICCCCGSVASE
jgi:hypothetical protein